MSYFSLALEQLELNLPANIQASPWTELRLEMLRELLPKHSAAQVAKTINKETGSNLTRNAVIGKAGRIGLKGHIAHPNNGPRKPRKQNSLRPYRIRQKNAQETSPMGMGDIQVDTDSPFNDAAGELRMEPKGIFELENNHCRWPCGEPRDPAFFYCGAEGADLTENRPYCQAHSKLAYTAARTPLRAAMAGPRG